MYTAKNGTHPPSPRRCLSSLQIGHRSNNTDRCAAVVAGARFRGATGVTRVARMVLMQMMLLIAAGRLHADDGRRGAGRVRRALRKR